MARLLKVLGLDRADIGDWPPKGVASAVSRGFEAVADLPLFAAASNNMDKGARRQRTQVVGEALRPAATTDAWRRIPSYPAAALWGLTGTSARARKKKH